MYRFAFELGSSSLGWAVYELDPCGRPNAIARLGVRIFPDGRDPQSHVSNAAERRGPRAARRQQDRRLSRRKRLVSDLLAFGLLPADDRVRSRVFALNPIEVRARAACEPVPLEMLGRALWHISRHRGFLSNRRAARDPDETGKIATASAALRASLAANGHVTYGAFLHARQQRGEPTRIRLVGDGASPAYEFYPTRDLLEAEFDCIWATQAAAHPALTAGMRDRLRDTIFFQRPLKPVQTGRCTFFPDRERLPKWHPLAQEFLILSQLNHLRIIHTGREHPLSLATRDLLARHLLAGSKLTWPKVRKLLKLPACAEINLESGGLRELPFNAVAAGLVGDAKKPGPLAALWPGLNQAMREELLERIAVTDDPEALIGWLMDRHQLPRELSEEVERAVLPAGHLRFCRDAVEALVREMRSDVVTYDQAVHRAPLLGGVDLDHADLLAGEAVDLLPPYNRLPVLQRMIGTGTGNPGDPELLRHGRITNPTMHVALGQFRRVMNALIAEYGKPAEVVIEATRDVARSAAEIRDLRKTSRENTQRNDRWCAELQKAGLLAAGDRVGDRLLRMRLWEELGRDPASRLCPYTGRPITLHDLHSDAVEIDHILPFEATFDDSPANKTVCFREASRRKGRRSPAEAAAQHPDFFDLAAIVARTRHLPRNKAWRFRDGAMLKWEETRSFEDRQLNATGYLARVVRAYAEALFPTTGAGARRRDHVWMLPGRMTAMLRSRWGLNLGDHNRKSRNDHRHHAIGAAVAGVIDHRMIQVLQTHARQIGVERLDRVLPDPPEPFAGFRDAVMAAVARVQVSHRPQHGSFDPGDSSKTSGKLHEDTVYGLVRDVPENRADLAIGNVVVRKPVVSLTRKEIGQVRDVKLRRSLVEATREVREGPLPERERKARFAAALAEWSRQTGHRRLRILKREATVRPVCDRDGRPFKWLLPGEIAWMDILERSDGTWFHHATDIWAANAGGATPWEQVYPGARFIMRIFKNDTIQLFDWDDAAECIVPGSNRIKRVNGLQPSAGRLQINDINEAGDLQKRHEDADDPFRWDFAKIGKLKLRRARRVRIDELGRVHTIPHGTV